MIIKNGLAAIPLDLTFYYRHRQTIPIIRPIRQPDRADHLRRCRCRTVNAHISGQIIVNDTQQQLTGSLSSCSDGILTLSRFGIEVKSAKSSASFLSVFDKK